MLFTEHKPVKHGLFVVQVVPEKDAGYCQWPGCDGTFTYVDDGTGLDVEAETEEVFRCECCGGWYCVSHFAQPFDAYCATCNSLPPAIIERIIDFRETLNKLR